MRYVRAIVAGLYAALSLCSVAAIALEIQHDVSFRAIVGFFGRDLLRQEDLGSLIGHHETTRQLISLWSLESRVNPGGLVYAENGSLQFYPHMTKEARGTRAAQLSNLEIYPRLASLYHSADLAALLAELDSPEVTALLHQRGVDTGEIAEMRAVSEHRSLGLAEKASLLRRTAIHIGEFVPYVKQPYYLPFGEQLRFYDRNRPSGAFVGLFEVDGLSLAEPDDHSYAEAMSRYSHYIVIVPSPYGGLLVKDYYRGARREYRIRDVAHPGGLRIRKVSEIS